MAGFLVVIIALLVLAVVFLATPLKEMVQSQNNSGVAREDTSESKPTTLEPEESASQSNLPVIKGTSPAENTSGAAREGTSGTKPTTVEPVEGAGESNNLPVINELLVSEGTIFTNAVVGLKAVALDPDGDSLIYTWHVSSGTLNSAHANPAEWTVPATPGNYSAKCVVDDEKGGIASDILIISVVEREDFTGSDIVLVPFETDPPESDRESGIIDTFSANLPFIGSESGSVMAGGFVPGDGSTPRFYVGDMSGDRQSIAFLTFDISGFSGAVIKSAKISIKILPEFTFGHPSDFITSIILSSLDWGEGLPTGGQLNPSRFPGTVIYSSSTPTLVFGNSTLVSELQNSIDTGKTKFKLRIHSIPSWDGDEENDGWFYSKDEVKLHILYSF